MRPVLKVWRDRSDRISVLRVVTLICLFSPLGKAIYDFDTIKLDARPITNLIHRTGDWALATAPCCAPQLRETSRDRCDRCDTCDKPNNDGHSRCHTCGRDV